MECPLEKKDKAVEQNKYMRSLEETIIKFCEDSITKQATDNEWIRKLIENTNSNIRALKTITKNLQEKAYQLTQKVLSNTGEKVEARTMVSKENVKELVPRDLPVVQTYVPPMQFLGSPYKTYETICAIGFPKEIQEGKGDMNDGCDITVEDVERLRKILTPSQSPAINDKLLSASLIDLSSMVSSTKVVAAVRFIRSSFIHFLEITRGKSVLEPSPFDLSTNFLLLILFFGSMAIAILLASEILDAEYKRISFWICLGKPATYFVKTSSVSMEIPKVTERRQNFMV
ncbi:hypothetical protein Tco_1380191 [Tanacetum coccineum]